MVSIPKKVSERLSKEVGRYQKILRSAKDRDVNESDTVTIITDMLADVFGFDKYSEITAEQAIRGTYCDLAVKVGGAVKYLIEVKAVGLDLKESHIRQAVNYGAKEGISWVVLTNGVDWEIYKIKLEKPLDWEQVISFNFLDMNPRKQEDQQRLFLLCRKGLSKAAIEKLHEQNQSVNKFVISAIIQKDSVLDVIRRELRRLVPGLKIGTEEVRKIVVGDVLKREVVEGDLAAKARKRVGKVNPTGRSKKKKQAIVSQPATVSVIPPDTEPKE